MPSIIREVTCEVIMSLYQKQSRHAVFNNVRLWCFNATSTLGLGQYGLCQQVQLKRNCC